MSQFTGVTLAQFNVPANSSARYTGIAAPFNEQPRGYFAPKGTSEVIWSSIVNILLTPLGTRIFLPTFGSLVAELVFEPNDEQLASLGRRYVIDALVQWEPRIRVLSSSVSRDLYNDQAISIRLSYEIIREGLVENRTLVFGGSLAGTP
jgi:phage baseplate assembly protein W